MAISLYRRISAQFANFVDTKCLFSLQIRDANRALGPCMSFLFLA